MERLFTKLRPAIPIVVGWLGGVFSAVAAELHVAPPPTGSDANPGTLAQPFATILYAEHQASPGDTIHIHAGTYRETVTFLQSGTPGMPVTYRAYDDGSGPDEVIVSGFDIIEPGVNGAGTWQLHQGSIYKIQLNANFGTVVGGSTLMLDGAVQKIARWPNVAGPFDYDWQNMAHPEGANFVGGSGAPLPPYSGSFFTASYNDAELPFSVDNEWVGARIDTSPNSGTHRSTGIVTASSNGSLTFRYRKDLSQTVTVGDPYFLWNSLVALDQEGEYFFDIEGVSGPAHTLYLWAPGGVSPETMVVEMKRRQFGFNLNWTAHNHIRDLHFVGGGIEVPPAASSIQLEDLTFRYCGSGLDTLGPARAAVWFKGADHVARNCEVAHSYGGGILTLGTNTEIRGNVVQDCMLYGIGTWESSAVVVEHNTVFQNGGENITMFSPGARFNFNHCYHGGFRLTDTANMNCHFIGSVDDMEVAYNWVHSNVGRFDPSFGWGGGRGIRMDTTPSNVVVHHNLVWNISNPDFSMSIWSLSPAQTNYQNSGLRIYNNTVEGLINIPGTGSLGGHEFRNNICAEIRDFGSTLHTVVADHNCLTVGKFISRWPGPANFVSADVFVSAPTGNFELHATSAARDAGVVIPGITDGYEGAAPDVGALEYANGNNPNWSAGALLREKDLAGLAYRFENHASGHPVVIVSGLPVGRVPAREFQLRLGGDTVLDDHRLVYSTVTHRGEAYFEVPTPLTTGVRGVEVSHAGGPFLATGQAVDVRIPGGLAIDSLTPSLTTAAGGTVHCIEGSGFGSPVWRLPVHLERMRVLDLNAVPVPIIFDSQAQIAAGRMMADGSDLRVIHRATGRALPFWIESGLNSTRTLLWTRFDSAALLYRERFSHRDESVLYLTFGDPGLASASDPATLLDFYPELSLPQLEVWIAANELGDHLGDGQAVGSWNNLGAGGNLVQPSGSLQPQIQHDQLGGLPTVSFNQSYLPFSGFPSSVTVGYSVLAVINPEQGGDTAGRLISVGNGGFEPSSVAVGSINDWTVLGVKRGYGGNITAMGTGRRFAGGLAYMTGEVAELLVFSSLLSDAAGFGMDRVSNYLRHKYQQGSTPRGVADAGGLLAPTEFLLRGHPLASLTVVDGGKATFTAPAADVLAPGEPLAFFADLSLSDGNTTVTAPAPLLYAEPAYGAWSASLPEGMRGANDDGDGDGIKNLTDFTTVSSGLRWDGTHFSFLRNMLATDVHVQFEYSSDLENWTLLPLDHPNVIILDPDPLGDQSAVLYGIAPLQPLLERQFYRLRSELVLP